MNEVIKIIYLNNLIKCYKSYFFEFDGMVYDFNHNANKYRVYLAEVIFFIKKYATENVKYFIDTSI